jgi:hypothetical protein
MRVLLHPGQSIVGSNPSSDFQLMTWGLSWWPWAAMHGVDPFRSMLLWPPTGFSTVWMTSVPVPALVALPLTLLAGPLVAYNVWMVAAVVLAAAAGYLLCFELTAKVLPSLLGAAVFAFSPYMLGHTLSQHLDLTVVFPLPLLALLGVRYVRGKTGGRQLVAGSAALLLVLAGSSLELFVDLALVLALVAALTLALARSRRPQLRPMLVRLGLAYAVCLPVLVPIAVLGVMQPHGAVQSPPSDFAVDLLNVVVPTPTLLTGRLGPASSLTSHFVGNIGERDGYIGLPLLLISFLALRSQWKRGAWIAGLVAAVALTLSFGPVLTAAGRPLISLPVSASSLPLAGNALPARMSVFVTLGLSCLCALWFAQPRSRVLQSLSALVLVVSLLPDFGPPRHIRNAWAVSDAFAWSTPQIPRGFVAARGWQRLVPRGATVLVLPTRDRTAASYWQVEARLGFRLAIPETPFVPPTLAAEPTVVELADNVLHQFDGSRLAAARLRSYLSEFHVADVVVPSAGNRGWQRIVQAAIPRRPTLLGGSLVFRVPARLPASTTSGELSVAVGRAGFRNPALRPTAAAWLQYDGRRARVLVLVKRSTSPAAPRILSSSGADAEFPRAAIDGRGDAAVVFLQWGDGELQMRASTSTPTGWQTVTLDRSRLPIWSPRVAVLSGGTVLASWTDDHGPSRTLWAAAYRPGQGWERPVALDHGDGLGVVALRAAGRLAVEAWHDSLANEARIVAAVFSGGAWHTPSRLAAGYGPLDAIAIDPTAGRFVRWRLWSPGRRVMFEATRRGLQWSRPSAVAAPP